MTEREGEKKVDCDDDQRMKSGIRTVRKQLDSKWSLQVLRVEYLNLTSFQAQLRPLVTLKNFYKPIYSLLSCCLVSSGLQLCVCLCRFTVIQPQQQQPRRHHHQHHHPKQPLNNQLKCHYSDKKDIYLVRTCEIVGLSCGNV